jgi:hypothetical protein
VSIEPIAGTVYYVNATKSNGSKIGIQLPGINRSKVIHVLTDEKFDIDDEVVVQVSRKPVEKPPTTWWGEHEAAVANG